MYSANCERVVISEAFIVAFVMCVRLDRAAVGLRLLVFKFDDAKVEPS